MTQPNGRSCVLDPYVDGEGKWLSRTPGQIGKLYHVIGTKKIPAQFFKVGIYMILPGESIPSHEHADGEEFAFVLKGEGLLLGENSRAIGPIPAHKLVHVPSGAPHGYVNLTTQTLEILVWTSTEAELTCGGAES